MTAKYKDGQTVERGDEVAIAGKVLAIGGEEFLVRFAGETWCFAASELTLVKRTEKPLAVGDRVRHALGGDTIYEVLAIRDHEAALYNRGEGLIVDLTRELTRISEREGE